MNEAQIQGYIAIVAGLYTLGASVAGKVGALIKLFHPDVTLTEDEINAIERAGIEDAERRAAERADMGKASA